MGAIAAALAARLSVRWWRRLAFPVVITSAVLLAAVIPFGKSVGGNRNWLVIGPLQFQPAELSQPPASTLNQPTAERPCTGSASDRRR